MSDPLKDPLTPAEEQVRKEVERKMRPRASRGRDVKKKKFYLLQVGPDEWYRLRRADLPTIFFEGLFPAPLLKAVDSFQDVRRKMANDDWSGALDGMSKEMRESFTEMLRRAAVAIVVEPRLTFSKKASLADPDLLWVGGYSDVEGERPDDLKGVPPHDEEGDVGISVLIVIWRALLNEGGIVVMPDDEAMEFRTREPELHAPPVLHGEGLRTETVVVDSPALAHAGASEETARKVRFLSLE